MPPTDIRQQGLAGYPDGSIRVAFINGLDGEVVEFIRRDDFPA